MQATVNSVLSPSSNVSSKSTLSPEASEPSQGQFADDFNRAKQALDSSASSDGRSMKEPTNDTRQSSSSIPPDPTPKDADGVQESKAQKGAGGLENGVSNTSVKTDVSGNRLQSEGESSPEENHGTDGKLKGGNSSEGGVKTKSSNPHIVVSSGAGTDSAIQLEKPSSDLSQSGETTPSTTGRISSQEQLNTTQTGKSVNGTVSVDGHVANNLINSDSVEHSKLVKSAPNLTGSQEPSSESKVGEAVSKQVSSSGHENTLHRSSQNGMVQMVDGQPHLAVSKTAANGVTGHLTLKGKEGEQQLLDAKGDKVVPSAAGALGLKALNTEATHAQTTAVHLDQNDQPAKAVLPDTVQLDQNGHPVKNSSLNSVQLDQNGNPVMENTEALQKGEVVSPQTKETTDLLLKANSGELVSHGQKGIQGDGAKSNDVSSKMSKIPPEVRALMAAENSEDKIKSTASSVDLSALSPMAQKQALASAKKVSEKGAEKVTDPSSNDKKETKKSGDGELSWVLSQMEANPIAPVSAAVAGVSAAARGTGSAPKSSSATPSISDQVSTSKVADQVALANALKSPMTGGGDTPLILANADSTTEASGLLNGKGASKASLSANEPIELRKKEQEAMIGKMVGQLDGVAKDSDPGGMGSSLANNGGRLAATGPALGATNPTQLTPTQQQNLAMSVPPNHPGWAGEMSQKVAWVAHNGAHSAHIKLDPPELGSLTVKVSVDSGNNNTQVSFVAATHHTRDLLEGQMGRLRDMLAQQGMDLGSVNVDVSQQDMSGTQYQTAESYQPQLNLGSLKGQENGEEEPVSGNISYVTPAGIDYYA
ncbi:Flagellar hook-length control protein [Marinomonas spartinae]|uniref:flagellar hook-length control protein FliK n=1 Tax=Marinomonas spartinae TaxID=1792290 RepID=UPI000808B3D5|nr:flagellar hook-length control protein FliK [Marinomonas spartinae]SBS26436.1 Flagellar hook-length control protein [Marinomonas spartinae]